MDARLVQFWKVFSPSSFTVSGRIRDLRPLQLENTSEPIFSRPSFSVTEARFTSL